MKAFILSFIVYRCCMVEADRSSRTSPPVLLHQRAASVRATVQSHNSETRTDSESQVGQPLGKKTRPVNPQPEGHMLTDKELHPIDSVACLQAKQADPRINCSTLVGVVDERPLNAGNYPLWTETRCNSEGEYFCDPDKLLTDSERQNLTATMKQLRTGQHVTCGPQLQHDPIDKWHYQPFYLGVAIAKDWPQHESDAQSLQSFGRMLASRWNMTFAWDGNPTFYARCPSEAILVILPEKHQAYLSSPSCMFICEENGGAQVSMATLLGLDSHGLMAGVSAGMSEVYKVLAQSSPMHKEGWQPEEKTAGTWSSWWKEAIAPQTQPTAIDETVWNVGQRILFGIAVLLLAGSLVVALLVCYLAPGLAKELNKSVV